MMMFKDKLGTTAQLICWIGESGKPEGMTLAWWTPERERDGLMPIEVNFSLN